MHPLYSQGVFLLGLLSSLASCQTVTSRNHPPVPTAALPPLPSDFRDIPTEYLDCWNSFYEYSFTSHFLLTEYMKSTTRVLTTFSPPRSSREYYSYDQTTDCSTTLFGTSTLCDNIPRATSRNVVCRTVPTIGTIEHFEYQSEITLITPTWTSQYKKPAPTCKAAPDLSPMCARMTDAWKYRTAVWRAEVPVPSDVTTWIYNAVPPCTPLAYAPDPTAKPLCKIVVGDYSAYHWPTPAPTGPAFCNANRTAIGGTPTIPGRPNTAIRFGLTLTSPSVYHFLQNVTVATFRGHAGQPGGLGAPAYAVWDLSATIPADTPLTVAQVESEILTASKLCRGIEGDYCTMQFDSDFRVHDMATVRKEAYEKQCDSRCLNYEGNVIVQNSYKPTLAVPVSELVWQNSGIFGDCQWDLRDDNYEHGWRSYTSSSIPAILVKDVVSTAFVPITTTAVRAQGLGLGLPTPRPTFKVLRPTPVA